MRELDYVVLDLDSESKETCDFCSNFYGEMLLGKWWVCFRWCCLWGVPRNNLIPKCERYRRLQTKLDIDLLYHYIRHKENLEEK